MKTLLTLLIVAVILILGGIGFAYSGLYNVSASAPHSGFVSWLLSTTSHASIERHAKEINVPDLSNDALARAGVNDFDAMCAGRHGAPGQTAAAMGQGLNPPAPDLTESASHMTPAELFWVTKHGIKMTGMPAWGASHDDEALWPVVAFMTRLPNLDADAYRAFKASAEGMGHHASESTHDDEHDHGDTPSTTDEDDATHSHAHDEHDDEHAEPAPPVDDHAGHDHEH